jgi:hypothetical protein
MEDKDLQIENILENNSKKKEKVDGKSKGDRTELNLCKILSEHFGAEFSRALGSGSRWSQVGNLPEHAKQTLSGDICVPEGFLWVIESKGGYENDVILTNMLDGKGISTLDSFIEQNTRDAEYTKRRPIILWKRNRKPWIAILRLADLGQYESGFDYRMYYREWVIVNFDDLLKATKNDRMFWFAK